MIFVTLGTQKFAFDRLLKDVDELIAEGVIVGDVICQSGYSRYKPDNFTTVGLLSADEFAAAIDGCDFVIAHGGVGTLLTALNAGKKIIAYPRLAAYKEHVDDHQREIVEKFSGLGYVLSCSDKATLRDCICGINSFETAYRAGGNTDGIALRISAYLQTLRASGKNK